MTELYDWFAFPHMVDVVCPVCEGNAYFDFAEIAQIKLKKDVPYFAGSDTFEYRQFMDTCGHKWHAAIWYKGIERFDLSTIDDLPKGCVHGGRGVRHRRKNCVPTGWKWADPLGIHRETL